MSHHFCRSAAISISEECDAWRKRALELEAKLHARWPTATPEDVGTGLLILYLISLTSTKELLVKKSAPGPAQEDATEPTPFTSKRKGKQTKKLPKTLEGRRPQTLEIPSTATSKLRDAVSSHNIEPSRPSTLTSDSLFSSLQALNDISTTITTKPDSSSDAARAVATTIRCIEALHDLLVRAVSPVSSAPEGATPREALEGIEYILPHILRMVASTLHHIVVDPLNAAGLTWHGDFADDELIRPHDTVPALDLIVGHVTTRLLVPAIRTLVPCTLSKTEHILSSLSPKKDFADGAQLLSLIAATLDALPDRQHIASYDRVALEAIRELTSLIVDRPSHIQHAQLTPAQRIHRIARKDALHFLCDAALLAFRRSSHASPGTPEETLRAALAEALGNLSLTQSVRGGVNRLDIVEEHRVMAVLECAWNIGLRDKDAVMVDVDGED
ncbi:hypothetical protein BJV74DRAFT_882631 [Russula compacta]|nr:hypothetical protein BJV74DRAFT_882631 [Russula compacta]